jgi:alkyl sulfatase BDS1-like metallo-beta-lactamase superfamily hydrolase
MNEAVDLYLQSTRKSRHFMTGYATCLVLAIQQHQKNPEWSRQMLQQLIQAQPEEKDARLLMREMFGEVESKK